MLRLFVSSACMLLMTVGIAVADETFPGADWETAEPVSQGVDAKKLDVARAWLASHNSKSGLVVRHGRIIAEWYFGETDRNTQFAAYSTSKSLSSLATGLAIADEKLKLDDTVGKFIPDASPASKKTITIKQLLSMTSGVHNDSQIGTRDDLFSFAIKSEPMDYEPGAKWDYNNTGLSLLSPVFHKATGQNIDEYLQQRLFQPIGIPDSDWKWEHREGLALPYSGCHMTARSMARIGHLVLHRGKWHDKQLVPAKWLAASASPSQKLNESYGYLWWNNTTNKWPGVPRDAFAAMGKWDNNILVVPSLDLVVVRQSDVAPQAGHQITEYFRAVCEAVDQK